MKLKNKYKIEMKANSNKYIAYGNIGLKLISLGIPANIKGYRYLNEAISIAANSSEVINHITTILYPDIAEKFKTNPSSVERAMRYAISVGCIRGCREKLNSLLGYKLYENVKIPTNSEFIALLSIVIKNAV